MDKLKQEFFDTFTDGVDAENDYYDSQFEEQKPYRIWSWIANKISQLESPVSLQSKALHIADVSKRISCYVAKNKGEFDIENMSLYKTESKAVKEWGKEQEIVKATIIF